MLFTVVLFTSLLVSSTTCATTPQMVSTEIKNTTDASKEIIETPCCSHAHHEVKITKEFETAPIPVATVPAAIETSPAIASAPEQKTVVLTATQTTIAITESTVSTTTIKQQPEAKSNVNKRSVKVVADMPKASLGYKHFFGTYYPTEFYLTVNGKKTGPEETVTVDCENNCIDITYYAQFQNGRETSRQYVYAIDPKKESITATFGWKVDNRVMLDDEKAQLTSFVEIIP